MNDFFGSFKEWNEHLLNEPSQAGIFLQSFGWGEFQKSVGVHVFRFEEIHQKIQVFEYRLPLGQKYWYVPRVRMHQKVLYALHEEAKKHGVLFIRLEPVALIDASKLKTVTVNSRQPHQTSIIECNKSDEILLAGMHQKTRYNIRLAQKKGVTVELDYEGKEIARFYALLTETSERNEFKTFPRSYYEQQIKCSETFLLHARFEGNIIASQLFWRFGDTLTYLHGASSNAHREVMAPYLIHFTALQMARTYGCHYYDLWGIDEQKWPSLTRFKRGFGGFDVEYPPAIEIVACQNYYRIFSLLKKMRNSIT